MKNLKKIFYLVVVIFLYTNISFAQTTKYKTMIQMQNYTGKEAYIIISLIDAKGNYEKTLGVLGPDQEWYNTLVEWDKYQSKKKEKLNAITGASVAGGARATRVIEFETSKLDSGYTIRFETAVETQKYHTKDAEISLTTNALGNKAGVQGNGYIKQIRFIKVQ